MHPSYGELEQSTNPGIITKFYETVETHLLQLPSDTTPIIGGDFNASIGVCSNPDDACIIGPYGLPHSNSAGEKLIDMVRNCSLQARATYFKHRSYETFYDLQNDRAPQQLDLIFVHQRHGGPHVTDAGVIQLRNNIISDHHATPLKLRLTRHLSKSKKAQIQNETGELLVEDPINWSILQKDKLKRQQCADKIETILFKYADCVSHEASPTQLSEAIMYMPLKAPSLKPKTARRTGSMPVNPSSDPSRTLPNVHIKTSSLMALTQTDNIGKPPAVITTKYSVKRRSNTLTKLL
jgi:hypothetical protein